jgi:hypothetical protein
MSKQSAILLCIVLATLASGGCATTMSPADLNAELRVGNMTTGDAWYYCGSEGGYDYLVNHRTSLVGTHHYRMHESESPVTFRFPYTTDREQWSVLPWGIMFDRKKVDGRQAAYGPAFP